MKFAFCVLAIPIALLLEDNIKVLITKCKKIQICRLPTNELFTLENLPVSHLFWRFFRKDSILIIGSRVPTKFEKQFLKWGLEDPPPEWYE